MVICAFMAVVLRKKLNRMSLGNVNGFVSFAVYYVLTQQKNKRIYECPGVKYNDGFNHLKNRVTKARQVPFINCYEWKIYIFYGGIPQYTH